MKVSIIKLLCCVCLNTVSLEHEMTVDKGAVPGSARFILLMHNNQKSLQLSMVAFNTDPLLLAKDITDKCFLCLSG